LVDMIAATCCLLAVFEKGHGTTLPARLIAS
jgi:hypothetical protein